MRDPGWKQFERKVLRRCGTERIPNTGARDGADGVTEMFAYQVKHRGKTQPPSDALLSWLDGIRATAERLGGDRIGVVIWQRGPRVPIGQSLVVLTLEDWEALHGPARQVEDEEAVHGADDMRPASTKGQ